jgi:hypothetical protein
MKLHERKQSTLSKQSNLGFQFFSDFKPYFKSYYYLKHLQYQLECDFQAFYVVSGKKCRLGIFGEGNKIYNYAWPQTCLNCVNVPYRLHSENYIFNYIIFIRKHRMVYKHNEENGERLRKRFAIEEQTMLFLRHSFLTQVEIYIFV